MTPKRPASYPFWQRTAPRRFLTECYFTLLPLLLRLRGRCPRCLLRAPFHKMYCTRR